MYTSAKDAFRASLRTSPVSPSYPRFGLPTARDWELLHQFSLLVWGARGDLVKRRGLAGFHWSEAAFQEPALQAGEVLGRTSQRRSHCSASRDTPNTRAAIREASAREHRERPLAARSVARGFRSAGTHGTAAVLRHRPRNLRWRQPAWNDEPGARAARAGVGSGRAPGGGQGRARGGASGRADSSVQPSTRYGE